MSQNELAPSGAIMVCGATSNAGKSTLVAGICRHYARRGLKVAPFKAQNMANNSAVTSSGEEIARAQAWQAAAAGVSPEVAMNPVLLKPTGPGTSQVVVMGRPVGTMTAAEYHRHKPQLLPVVLDALATLRERYDVVVLEGAGSPAEINLLDADIVNLRIAHEAGLSSVVVGDIDLGGVFASLYGTVALLPDHYRQRVKAFVINKLRGDPALLFDGTATLEGLTGIPTLGVLPWLSEPEIDSEDSLALDRPLDHSDRYGYSDRGGRPTADGEELEGDLLDVAVVRLPHIANFTDLDPLRIEAGISLRWVDDPRSVGQPDLLILPGSKTTVADLAWLRERGLDRAIVGIRGTVLGICAGYQMLGRAISDPGGVESSELAVDGLAVDGLGVDGLGLLDAHTRFTSQKVTRGRTGEAWGHKASGYQIHHGVVSAAGPPLVELTDVAGAPGDGDGAVGVTPAGGTVWGTTLHGLLEGDDLRAAMLASVAAKAGKRRPPASPPVCFEDARQRRIDALADAVEAHLDLAALDRIVAGGALR